MRKVVIGGVCAAAIIAAVSAVACQVQGSCESSPVFIDYCTPTDNTCQGRVIDATHWESSPQDGAFLSYGAEQVWHMHFRDPQGNAISGTLANLFVQVSASQQGNAPGNNWIVGADQLVEATFDSDGTGVTIRNDTCGVYFFRVVVTLIPNTPTDAGTD